MATRTVPDGSPSGSARGGPRTALRVAAAALPPLAVVSWTALDDAWRTADGSLAPAAPFLWAVGSSIAMVVVAAGSNWQRAARLAALALLGQAAALQLIDAPPYAAFQHFVGWGTLHEGARRQIALLLLAAQTVAVLALGRSAVAGFACAIARGRFLAWYGVLAVVGVWLFSAAVPTRSVSAFGGEILFTVWVGALAFFTLILAVRAIPDARLAGAVVWLSRRITLPGGGSGTPRPWDRAFPWALAGIAATVASLMAVAVFERVPHIDDSVAYLFQAKYFAAGRLYLPAPPDPAAFEIPHVLNDGARWFSKYPPGWPAVLALGVFPGVPWMVNPVLAGLTVLVAHAVVRLLYDRGIANAAAALLVTSPWFLFMSASLMAHPLGALLGLVAIYAVLRERASGRGRWGLMAGAALGMLSLTRPLEAVLVGGAVVVWGLRFGERRLRMAGLVGIVAGGAAVSALVLPYNALLTGDPLRSPFTLWSSLAYGPGTDVLGFGPGVGIPAWPNLDPLPGHGAADVVLNLNKNLHLANTELFGWLFGSLSLLLAGVFLRGARRGSGLLWLLVGWVVVGHSLYWFSGGPDFGPRYWYQLLVPLTALSVIAAAALDARLGRVAPFVGIAALCATLTFVPWRAVTKYHHYRDMSGDVARLAAEAGIVGGLVLVRSVGPRDYAAAFVQNPPALDQDGTVYARDVDPERTASVVRAFPERPVWVIGRREGATFPFVILAGPLPPGTIPD